jgi:membrane protease YdiL (CAAX protease family)
MVFPFVLHIALNIYPRITIYYYTVAGKGCQKEGAMNSLMEPFILYAVLFLPGLLPGSAAESAGAFSVSGELIRIAGYNIPSLLLVVYLMSRRQRGHPALRPQSADGLSLAIALPGLLAIALVLSGIAPIFSPVQSSLPVAAPRSILAWFVMVLSCLSTGYLEETYFRHYLSTRFEMGGLPSYLGIGISVILFALCHVYEGLWGTVNAVLAGLLLSLVYRRYGALHGIAWAHGMYNAFVYATGI